MYLTYAQETVEGRGSLAEEKADVFERVLEFIYTGEYDLGISEPELVSDDHIDVSGNQDSLDVDRRDSSAFSRQQSQELMLHAEVYLLAKYLAVGELMKHATEKFTAVFKKSFRPDTCIEPFVRVFNAGDDCSDGLRAQILRLCLENSEHIPQDGELTRLLMEHEPVAWKLLSWRDEEHARQIDEAVKVRQILEAEVGAFQGTIKTLGQRVVDLNADRDRILALLEKHDNCRNCDKEFGSYVDEDERGIVRCKKCRCRHYLER